MVKTRFAPSPTGFLHIGGARTCLFSWLYARGKKGKFSLRIEDTDKQRSRGECLDEILESLKWLGLDWDEIIYQSERFDLYKQYAQNLIDSNRAFQKEGAVFFKYDAGEVRVDDLIRGRIVFSELPKAEEVIIKGDGSPAYNFACVIDDALSQITHVIRGEDHISNTPKQILMYKALGFKIPEFAHLPLILSEDGSRMSKRFGATSIREYRQQGYLPETLVNYLLLLGWSPGNNREIISLREAQGIFDIKDINKTASMFSLDKLNWINAEYIKAVSLEELASMAKDFLQGKKFLPAWVDDGYLKKVLNLYKGRLASFTNLLDWTRFCFYDDYEYSPEGRQVLEKNLSGEFTALIEQLSSLEDFSKDAIELKFRAVAQELGLKARILVHPTRVALTGRRVGPGLFETMELLGKKRVVERLRNLLAYWGGGK